MISKKASSNDTPDLQRSKTPAVECNACPHCLLPQLHIAPHPASLPLYSHLFAICRRSHTPLRPIPRWLACLETNSALPPLWWLGLRPRPLTFFYLEITNFITIFAIGNCIGKAMHQFDYQPKQHTMNKKILFSSAFMLLPSTIGNRQQHYGSDGTYLVRVGDRTTRRIVVIK